MGERNYLVEGVSGTGKTAVCTELQRRGHHAVHGDRELAYRGDPRTGAPIPGGGDRIEEHDRHLWSIAKVEALVADRSRPETFFCGGARNLPRFVGLFDAVLVLEADPDTVQQRLQRRPADEWGSGQAEQELVRRLQRSGTGVPDGIAIDATAPLDRVVDAVLAATARLGSARPPADAS